MPIPVSVTDMQTKFPSSNAIDVDLAALGREFHRIAQQVVQDLLETNSISIDGQISLQVLLNLDVLRHGQRTDGGEDLRQGIFDLEIFASEFDCPASIFERSRMSLINCNRCAEPCLMWLTKRFCLALSSPGVPSARSSEKPTMAFSGVRNSWLMLARNLLFRLGCAFDFAIAEFEFVVAGGQALGEFALLRFVPLSLGHVNRDHNLRGPVGKR